MVYKKLFVILILVLYPGLFPAQEKPNMIFILADDLG